MSDLVPSRYLCGREILIPDVMVGFDFRMTLTLPLTIDFFRCLSFDLGWSVWALLLFRKDTKVDVFFP